MGKRTRQAPVKYAKKRVSEEDEKPMKKQKKAKRSNVKKELEPKENIEALVNEIGDVYRRDNGPIDIQDASALLLDSALVNLKLEGFEDAIADATKALTIDESNLKARLCRAVALERLNRDVEALPDLQACVLVSENGIIRKMLTETAEKAEMTSINRLPDNVLIDILHKLPIKERVRAELVSKRWNRVMNEQGWSNITALSIPFGKPGSYLKLRMRGINRKIWPLFKRCARFLKEINLENFLISGSFGYYLSRCTSIEHLNMGCTNLEANAVRVMGFHNVFDKLKSLIMIVDVHPLTDIFRMCKVLEFLRLDVLRETASLILPPTLKYLDIGGPFISTELLRSVSQQAVGLETLILQKSIGGIDIDGSFKFKSLKYLSVSIGSHMSCANVDVLLRLLKNHPNLLALDIAVSSNCAEMGMAQWIATATSNCTELEHLGIEFEDSLKEYAVDLSLNLCSLKSLSIVGKVNDDEFSQLFDQILLKGELMYLETTAAVPIDLVCKTLKACKVLTHISWKYDSDIDWDLVLKTLDQIHGAGTKPNEIIDYSRVLRIFGCDDIPTISHPWLKFFETRIPSSVGEQIRLGCLSSVPTFATNR